MPCSTPLPGAAGLDVVAFEAALRRARADGLDGNAVREAKTHHH
jgi:hypothetical protein